MILAAANGWFGGDRTASLASIRSFNWFGHDISPTEASLGTTIVEWLGFTLVAVGEEGLFRGVVQTELSERVNPNFGLVTSSLLFGVFHVPFHGWWSGLGASGVGLYLGWQYKKSGYNLGRS